MASEFEGKRVLVTGGARGLGEAVVRQFVDLGAIVFALDREEALLEKLKTDLPQVTTIALDLQDWEGTRTAVKNIAPIHHLVNNAGVGGGYTLLNVDEKAVDTIFSINFKAAINVSQTVVQGLIDHQVEGGTIVNISSVLGQKPVPNDSMYCCSKAALTMLTKCQAIEFGEHNVRVNCISPTLMPTGIVSDPAVMQAMLTEVLKRQIIKRQLQTSEAADIIVFLSSKKAAMITAEDFVIDGGLLANL